jgi:hypothetical protein
MCLRICGCFKSANHKKDWFLKSHIRKEPHFRKVRKSKQIMYVGKFVDLRFAELIYLLKLFIKII